MEIEIGIEANRKGGLKKIEIRFINKKNNR